MSGYRDISGSGKIIRRHLSSPYDGEILNLSAHDLEEWPTVLGHWSNVVTRKYLELDSQMNTAEMYSYLETFLGDPARAIWESYKKEYPVDFEKVLELGRDPYNFTTKVYMLVLGEHPDVEREKRRTEAIRMLARLQLKKWTDINLFLQDFLYYSSIAGKLYDQDVGETLFQKLPGPLGLEIHRKYKEYIRDNPNMLPGLNNICTKIKFISDRYEEQLIQIQCQIQIDDLIRTKQFS